MSTSLDIVRYRSWHLLFAFVARLDRYHFLWTICTATPPSQSSNCTFALGAEVQTLDIYSGDTNELASGEYRLRYTTTADDGVVSASTSE